MHVYLVGKNSFFIFPLEKKIPSQPLLGLAYWAGQFASQVTDGHSVYQDMVRLSRYITTLHDQEPVSFQRLSPKSAKSKEYKLDSLEIDKMEEAIEDEAKNDPRYL